MNILGFKQTAKVLGQAVAKNSPTILTGIGVAGLVTTSVLAVSSTPKALQILEREASIRQNESNREHIDPLSVKDIIQLTWKCYIPSLVIGTVTIGCIVSANSINLHRNAALAGLYSLSETAIKEYQAKVVETIGKTKEQKIKDEIAKDKINRTPVESMEVIHTGKGDTLCYDTISGRYFKSDIEHIRQVINALSREMMTEMFVTVNEVYYELGLQQVKMGDLIGWHIDDGLIEVNFSSQLTDNGTPCLVMDFEVSPKYDRPREY